MTGKNTITIIRNYQVQWSNMPNVWITAWIANTNKIVISMLLDNYSKEQADINIQEKDGLSVPILA